LDRFLFFGRPEFGVLGDGLGNGEETMQFADKLLSAGNFDFDGWCRNGAIAVQKRVEAM
jgi:hypothetical protein